MKKYIAYFLLLLLMIGGFMILQVQINQLKNSEANLTEEVYGEGMFAWDNKTYLMENRVDSFRNLEQLNITTLYQEIEQEELYSDDFTSFLKQANQLNIEVVYLCGDASWALEREAIKMKEKIDEIVAFNQTMEYDTQIRWINFDVEPYLTDMWDEDRDGLMEIYVQAMKEAYSYAQSKGIKVSICIPHWLDNRYEEIVEELIKNACDEISIMNYDRNDEVANMDSELAMAKKYNKRIVCIFEFQKPGKHDLESFNTYYDLGVEAAKERFEELRAIFDYDSLSFAYHYYTPIIGMLN